MENIVYVTGNKGKYLSVKEKFNKNNIEIDFYNLDLVEIDINDIHEVSKNKAIYAYEILKRPLFVIDSGFYIRSYPNNPGYPGAFVKRSKVASDVYKLLDDMKDVSDRYCYFLDCLTYYDGCEFKFFYGKSVGELSYEVSEVSSDKMKSNLWKVFIPKGGKKVLVELDEEEKELTNLFKTDATINFIEYLKENEKIKKLIKS